MNSPSEYAIAIHGGAGVISNDIPLQRKEEYLSALERILRSGQQQLCEGKSALDVVQAVVEQFEDDSHFNAGHGSVYTREGTHELEASIMDGKTLSCGAVAMIESVRHPIRLARIVMEQTPHIILAGKGAESLAERFQLEKVSQGFFDTEHRHEQLQAFLKQTKANSESNGGANYVIEDNRTSSTTEGDTETVGCVARDQNGDLAAATSTGGRTGKWIGRIGDTPIPGAGNYAHNEWCAVSATGFGEEFIRHVVARDIAAMMEYGNMSLPEAASLMVNDKLKPRVGGIIAVSKNGDIAMPYNSTGMFRGAAHANGRFEFAIWDQIHSR